MTKLTIWKEDATKTLVELYEKSASLADISAALGISSKQCHDKLVKLGATNGRKIRRPCLTCGGDFFSEGNHNRMCPECKGASNAP